MKTKQVATQVRFNHESKSFSIVVWNNEERNGQTLEILDFESLEQAEKIAESMRTYCPLSFEYPSNEDGSIYFY